MYIFEKIIYAAEMTILITCGMCSNPFTHKGPDPFKKIYIYYFNTSFYESMYTFVYSEYALL